MSCKLLIKLIRLGFFDEKQKIVICSLFTISLKYYVRKNSFRKSFYDTMEQLSLFIVEKNDPHLLGQCVSGLAHEKVKDSLLQLENSSKITIERVLIKHLETEKKVLATPNFGMYYKIILDRLYRKISILVIFLKVSLRFDLYHFLLQEQPPKLLKTLIEAENDSVGRSETACQLISLFDYATRPLNESNVESLSQHVNLINMCEIDVSNNDQLRGGVLRFIQSGLTKPNLLTKNFFGILAGCLSWNLKTKILMELISIPWISDHYALYDFSPDDSKILESAQKHIQLKPEYNDIKLLSLHLIVFIDKDCCIQWRSQIFDGCLVQFFIFF